MTAEEAVQAALVAALSDGLAGQVNQVCDGPAVAASAPYAEILPLLAGEWGSKDPVGRELRVAVAIHDHSDRPGRALALAGAAEAAIAGLPRDLSGWRIASLVFVRGRTVSAKPGWWLATVEYRVRVLKV